MFIARFLLLNSLFFSSSLFAFPCFITLAKDNCWLNYDVTVIIKDVAVNQQVASITVPKGQAWGREAFTCQPAQKFMFFASFNPSIWESDFNKTFIAKRYWSLPATISSGETAWNLPVCYSNDFAEIPLPPTANSRCQCDFSKIPAIPT